MSDETWFLVVGLGALALVVTLAIRSANNLDQPHFDDSAVADAPATKACMLCGKAAELAATECECGYKFSAAVIAETSHALAPTRLPSPNRADDWRTWGWLLAIFGVIGLGIGFTMSTTVETYGTADIFGSGGAGQIVNLDLMFRKGVTIACGLVTFGLGIVCLGVAAIVNAIHAASR